MHITLSRFLTTLVALATVAVAAPAAALASPANDFRNSAIVQVAEQSATGSYGGQCYVFMSNVVYKASGDWIRIDGSHAYYGAYQRAGATLQTDASARPGDIIQVYDRYNDGEYIPRMHTAIITANLGHRRHPCSP
jgi:hypothetical protein